MGAEPGLDARAAVSATAGYAQRAPKVEPDRPTGSPTEGPHAGKAPGMGGALVPHARSTAAGRRHRSSNSGRKTSPCEKGRR